MKKWLVLVGTISIFAIIICFITEYTPVDILEIQASTLELNVGETVQLTVKGYKYQNNKDEIKEIDMSKIKIDWYAEGENRKEIVKVEATGELIALKEGNANVQVRYKNKVYSRPITVLVGNN